MSDRKIIYLDDAIDALKREQAYYAHEDGAEIFYEYNHAIEALKNLPSAESEIIHCKDCKHYYNVLYKGTQFECGKCCRTFTEDVKPDDYCSRGE